MVLCPAGGFLDRDVLLAAFMVSDDAPGARSGRDLVDGQPICK
jgi:hypothetical protein